MPAVIRTTTLTRDHFDAITAKALEKAPVEGVLHEESGDRDVAISTLFDPQGLYPIAYQLISEPRSPIVNADKLTILAADGRKLPPAPAPDKAQRVKLSPQGQPA